ncbi:malonyl-CoA synthase [Minwuia thermotolerans]|uniref:Malonyl-CoA synthase n=2 Tax=Minwuia thermotolerans TaxID=2056226 RepID=A0A2M9FVB6_9PROT|nr:malonyl-CoA synthase [Minwuia thermotolerans]
MIDSNLVGKFIATSERSHDAIFLRTPSGKRLSYRDLWNDVAAYRAALDAHGVQSGDRVMVQVEKSPEAISLYLATLSAGAAFVPLNTGYTEAELRHFLTDAAPRLFIADPARRSDLTALARGCGVDRVETLGMDGSGSLPEAAATAPASLSIEPCGPDHIAAILYTSGTTGRPKGAMLTHRNLGANAEALCVAWEITGRDVLLHALPIFHAHGLFVAINTTLLAGAGLIFLPKFEVDVVLQALPEATTMMGVPTFYTRLLDDPRFDAAATAHMRLFVSGSAPLLENTFHAFRECTGRAILERYGMTETGMNTSNPLHGERKAGSIGPALPGVEVRVADDAGRALGTGKVGVLEVRGPNVFRGYWNMPERTAEDFRQDGFFITGDLARIDPEAYVWLVGRAKDLIITGGYNVYPKEVEVCLDALPGIRESAVIGVPDSDFGEAVVAVVVADDPAQPPVAEALVSELRSSLARYKLPKRIVFVDNLPRNTMGKVQKNLLRDAIAGN